MTFSNGKKPPLSEVFDIKDKDGNAIYCSEHGHLFIKLKNEKRSRQIGRLEYRLIRPAERMLIYLKDDSESQVFRKTDAWSIPWEIVNRVGGIEIHSETHVYKILASKAKEVGSFLHFKTEGIERKLYIPRIHFHTKPIIHEHEQ